MDANFTFLQYIVYFSDLRILLAIYSYSIKYLDYNIDFINIILFTSYLLQFRKYKLKQVNCLKSNTKCKKRNTLLFDFVQDEFRDCH